MLAAPEFRVHSNPSQALTGASLSGLAVHSDDTAATARVAAACAAAADLAVAAAVAAAAAIAAQPLLSVSAELSHQVHWRGLMVVQRHPHHGAGHGAVGVPPPVFCAQIVYLDPGFGFVLGKVWIRLANVLASHLRVGDGTGFIRVLQACAEAQPCSVVTLNFPACLFCNSCNTADIRLRYRPASIRQQQVWAHQSIALHRRADQRGHD
eukprot:359486-Chlamydomonas_euryale.AAC.4